jgi:hypothetical protein
VFNSKELSKLRGEGGCGTWGLTFMNKNMLFGLNFRITWDAVLRMNISGFYPRLSESKK